MFDVLLRRLLDRRAHIGVIGLGYVGLPLARAFHEAGFAVKGFDTDAQKPARLAAGRSHIMDVSDSEVARMAGSGRFEATDDFTRLGEADAVAICVPTPLGPDREPDLRFVEASARAVAAALRPGQLVVLESTTWPGTTEEVVKPILEAAGLRSGHDFFLAYAPERNLPAAANGASRVSWARTVRKRWRSPGRSTRPCPRRCMPFPRRQRRRRPSSPRTSSGPSTSRSSTNSRASTPRWVWMSGKSSRPSTKPFGYMPFWPGPGWGGHCIPIDPFYLAWKARGVGLPSRFIELAGEINAEMPERVIARLAEALAPAALAGSRILLAGVAYKKNIDDIRESPALRLWELLEAGGAEVAYFDPHVWTIPPTRVIPSLPARPA